MAQAPAERSRILAELEGRSCNYCDAGELVKERYKGYDAVVCENCDVPQVRFF